MKPFWCWFGLHRWRYEDYGCGGWYNTCILCGKTRKVK